MHAIWTAVRRRFPKQFLAVHRALAALLLLCATVHWWPFIFFLCPAVAVQATARALDDDDSAVASGALAAALVAAVAGVCATWYVRQTVLVGTTDVRPALPCFRRADHL